jgi:hypothetical protein
LINLGTEAYWQTEIKEGTMLAATGWQMGFPGLWAQGCQGLVLTRMKETSI